MVAYILKETFEITTCVTLCFDIHYINNSPLFENDTCCVCHVCPKGVWFCTYPFTDIL